MNIIVKPLPNGLNQDSFGIVINIAPNNTDMKIVTIYTKIMLRSLTFIDTTPTNSTNNNKNRLNNKEGASSPLENCSVS